MIKIGKQNNKQINKKNIETMRCSTIIKEEEIKTIKDWINPNETYNFELLYKASRDGDEVITFHHLCDGKGPTLVVIKNSSDCRFGGFTSVPWSYSKNGEWVSDDKAFIFSLDSKKKYPVVNKENALYHHAGYGPTFGRAHDIYICHLCLHQGSSSCKAGYDYDAKFEEITKGKDSFLITDYEVYLVKK